MSGHQSPRSLAKKFSEGYPHDLPDRLEWWRSHLGIDRARLLRMMGFSATEAQQERDVPWEALLADNSRMERAWWVEGKLHELLALYDYDWNQLSRRLHQPIEVRRSELTRRPRSPGSVEKLRSVPEEPGAAILLSQIAEGGPTSFDALMRFLGADSRP